MTIEKLLNFITGSLIYVSYDKNKKMLAWFKKKVSLIQFNHAGRKSVC